MEAQVIIENFYQFLVDDDTIGPDQELVLCNAAYDTLLVSDPWDFLLTEDDTNTVSAGTKNYSLPNDFLLPRYVQLYDSSTDNFQRIEFVKYDRRFKHHRDQGKVYIDRKNSELVFTADPKKHSGEKIIIGYNYQPPELEIDDEPVFNRAFHRILAFEMARLYWYNEQDEKNRMFTNEMSDEYNRLYALMQKWDTNFEVTTAKDTLPDESWLHGNNNRSFFS